MCFLRAKLNMNINDFKTVNLPFLQGIRFKIYPFARTITKVIYGCSDLSTTFKEINIRWKSIFRTFRNNIANSSVRNDIKIT